ncbi:MAG: SET domain-containing protein [Flavobacteriaceae bacterium]|jgi:SET domain-containing protein|nr:SET domain-containing protein [Flavobacteriaceae bacterium]MDG2385906.1 SET domain-containing protein [Flavobacteriaceae bacterium]
MIKDSNWRPLPDFLTIKQSTIEGLGLFTTDQIKQGDDLGMTHVFDPRFHDNYLRLPLGAFVNHHEIPNCKAVFCEEDEKLGKVKHIRIVALNDIEKGSEITVKYVINKLDNPNWEHAYETTQ